MPLSKAQMREYMRKRRCKPGEVVNQLCKPVDPWEDLREYVRRPGMLERTQAICGGKHADQVYFGLGGLTARDIGAIIGTRPGLAPK